MPPPQFLSTSTFIAMHHCNCRANSGKRRNKYQFNACDEIQNLWTKNTLIPLLVLMVKRSVCSYLILFQHFNPVCFVFSSIYVVIACYELLYMSSVWSENVILFWTENFTCTVGIQHWIFHRTSLCVMNKKKKLSSVLVHYDSLSFVCDWEYSTWL